MKKPTPGRAEPETVADHNQSVSDFKRNVSPEELHSVTPDELLSPTLPSTNATLLDPTATVDTILTTDSLGGLDANTTELNGA